MTKNLFKIFMDFDGTVTQQDVGDAIYKNFGDELEVNKIIENLLQGRISSRECWSKLCSIMPPVNKKELDDFIDSMLLDSTFIKFWEYCRKEKFDLYILSDGFDYYIDRILHKHKIDGLKVFANHLEIADSNLVLSFPYYAESCFSSANCKKNHIINNSSDDEFTVFVGDGNSDKDSVEYCDFIFAKDDLLRFCEMERITFFPFTNFNDVMKKLNELKEKKRLKKPNRANLKRRQAYMME